MSDINDIRKQALAVLKPSYPPCIITSREGHLSFRFDPTGSLVAGDKINDGVDGEVVILEVLKYRSQT